MAAQFVKLGKRRYAFLPEMEYRRLLAQARIAAEGPGPNLPKPIAGGRFPAVEYARASLARKIIRERQAAGLTQAELARRAGIRPETLNRIEKGRTTPDVATIAKIESALEQAGAENESEETPVGRRRFSRSRAVHGRLR
jgi:DNA-binding XRE family transcriptional regulator